jgi:hypothetical protein
MRPAEARRVRLTGAAIAGIVGAVLALGGLVANALAVALPMLPVLVLHALALSPRVVSGMRQNRWWSLAWIACSTAIFTSLVVGLYVVVTAARGAPIAEEGAAFGAVVVGALRYAVETALPVAAVAVIVWGLALHALEP